MRSPSEARPKSTPKKASQSGHLPVKGLTTSRITPTEKTGYRTYNTGLNYAKVQ